MKKLLLAVVLISLFAALASAGNICPGGNSTNFVTLSPSISGATGHDPDPTGTGCNTLITINANNTVTVTIPDAAPYEGVEDNLVGVVNNSSSIITSLSLSGSGIFGLDADGLCLFTWAAANGVVSSSYCSATQKAGTDPQDYYGPTSTFSITNVNAGFVNFGPGIAAGGGKTFFSLEEPPNAQLVVTPGAPEPRSIVLICSGLGLLLLRKRRAYRSV